MEEAYTTIQASLQHLIVLIRANQIQAMAALFLAGIVGGSRNSVKWRIWLIILSYFPMLFVVVTFSRLYFQEEYSAIASAVIIAIASSITWKSNSTGDKKG